MFSHCCKSCFLSQPGLGGWGQAPQGPGGGQAWPVWLVLLVAKAQGPHFTPETRPWSPWTLQAPGGATESVSYRFYVLKGSLPPKISALWRAGPGSFLR